MNGEDYVELRAQVGESVEQVGEPGEIVYVGRAMQGHQRVAGRQVRGGMLLGAGQETHESIDHHVANTVNLGGVDAFANKIFIAVGRGSEEQVGELVGEQPI